MKLSYLILLFALFSLNAIEESIISKMEYYERIENIPAKKFSQKYYEKICRELDRKNEKIRVVTYNMLFDFYDFKMKDEENKWPNRLPRILKLLNHMNPDIICAQELYPKQVEDIYLKLGDKYEFFPGYINRWGESCGIFYRKNRFDVVLSEVESPLSILKLKELATGKIFTLFNTHLAFSNVEKREQQVYKIAKKIESYAKSGAVILTGDFNTFPERLDLKGLPFYDGDQIHRILRRAHIENTERRSLLGHLGPISTFTDAGNSDPTPFKGKGTPGVVLDYIYTSKEVTVLIHGTESGKVDGHYPSDHMPVVVDLLLD